MNTNIDNDLDALSKKLYLESPDLWIEFLDKVNEKVFDEMVLFFSIKYNMPSILEYVIDNNKLNLDSKSKNANYSSIRSHLITVSNQYNCHEALALLTNTSTSPIKDVKPTDNEKITEKVTKNIPNFICQNCKCNIFDLGFKIINNSVHKFSNSENKLIEIPSSDSSQVICNNCNKIISNTTLDKLENMCKVQCCNNCGQDLTSVGIYDTSKLEYDSKSNKFISKSTQYNCGSCNNILDKNQKDYFNL